MINKFYEQIDGVVNNVNNISDEQLNTIDMDYLKCKRVGKHLFIVALFDTTFLTKLWEIHDSAFYGLQFPNVIFKCYALIVIDIDMNKYYTHRLYSFPINTDLYTGDRSVFNAKNFYSNIEKQIIDKVITLSFDLPYEFSSVIFNTTKPTSTVRNNYFNIRGKISTEFDFDIDKFIDKFVTIESDNIHIKDTYYNRPSITKEIILNDLECTCLDEGETSNMACYCDDRSNCGKFHLKKCQCGKLTFYRRNSCLYCYVVHTRSKKIQNMFNRVRDDEEISSNYIRVHRSLVSYIPYLHYNQNDSGLCLGSGGSHIDNTISIELNPVRIMLTFKANLAYTDADSTTSYYNGYSDSFTTSTFDKYIEYIGYLNNCYRSEIGKIRVNRHVFSMYCYCPECLFYKIVMFLEDKKIHKRGFEYNKSYHISRNHFIAYYKSYLNKNLRYIDGYMHKIIKQVINIPPLEQMIIEE